MAFKRTGRPGSVDMRHVRVQGSVAQLLEISRSRLVFLAMIFCLSFSALGLRLVDLATTDAETAARKHIAVLDNTKLKINRAPIVDRNGVILATNLKTASLYANPKKLLNIKEAADALYTLFPDLDRKILLSKLSSDKEFVWIRRNLHPREQLAVNNLGLPGLEFREEEKRTYPHGSVAAHVLGFVGVDGKGLSGIEREFNTQLIKKTNTPLQLSIDIRVQDVLHRELMKEFEDHEAKGAAGLVMDANNGEILAMVSLPDFDPNLPSAADRRAMFNHATLGVYEMGSTFKTFTMAMALDSGLVKLGDSFDATRPLRVAGYTIRDHHGKERWLSLPEIYMYSSNIGTARIADKIGGEVQRTFLSKLGMLDGLALELPEISSPLTPDRWGRIQTMTIGFGHGIAVTPVHVATATAALINDGMLRQATLLKDGGDSEAVRVVSSKTSTLMRKLFRLVVKEGTGKKADAKGYLVGGKTGTAEKAGGDSYDRTRLVSSFVGAFPMDDPRYIVMAVMDEPKGNARSFGYATAGFTAAPVVKNVIQQVAPMLGIKPVDEDSKTYQRMFHVDTHKKGHYVASRRSAYSPF